MIGDTLHALTPKINDACFCNLMKILEKNLICLFLRENRIIDIAHQGPLKAKVICVSLSFAEGRHDVIKQILTDVCFAVEDSDIREKCDSIVERRIKEPSVLEHNFFYILSALQNKYGKIVFFLDSEQGIAQFSDVEKDLFDKIKTKPSLNQIRFLTEIDGNDKNLIQQNKTKLPSIRIIPMEEIENQSKMVFISHKWDNGSGTSAVSIEEALADKGIKYSIDKKDCELGDDIRKYETIVGSGAVVIAVVNEKYMESIACMRELAIVFEKGDVEDRLCFVLCADRQVFKPEEQKNYLDKWERKKEELESKVCDEPDNIIYKERIKSIDSIIKYTPDIWRYVENHNTIGSYELAENKWERLVKRVLELIGKSDDQRDEIAKNDGPAAASYVCNGGKQVIINGPQNIGGDFNM